MGDKQINVMLFIFVLAFASVVVLVVTGVVDDKYRQYKWNRYISSREETKRLIDAGAVCEHPERDRFYWPYSKNPKGQDQTMCGLCGAFVEGGYKPVAKHGGIAIGHGAVTEGKAVLLR